MLYGQESYRNSSFENLGFFSTLLQTIVYIAILLLEYPICQISCYWLSKLYISMEV